MQVSKMNTPPKPMPSVLVVDDEPIHLDIVGMHLTQLGVNQISVARNGRKALRLLSLPGRQPDLILLDLYMPEMDGIEFLEELSKLSFAGSIVLFSGVNIDMLDMARCIAQDLKLNLIGAAEKPVSIELLADLLARVPRPHDGGVVRPS